uniref:GTP:AMP phosphotransferase, mitochondrial n=1 Tax=Glossina pallidipes TaxID=7398 RepID=A0A1A9Z9X4_GLOPL
MYKKIIRASLLGPPGSGKSTVAKRILEEFDLVHISPGDLLRANIQKKTDLGKQAEAYVNQGKLVPDNIIIEFITNHLKDLNCASFLLDGFPRNVTQAKCLSEVQTLNAVIYLNIPHEELIRRIEGRFVHLKSGRVYNTNFNKPKVPGKDDVTGEDLIKRDDDKPEVFAERLKTYDQTVKPILEYYEKEFPGILKTLNDKTSDEIILWNFQMLKKAVRAVILGPPASGKGTISKRIVEKFDFVHISPGDILRSNIEKQTKLGKEAETYVKQGKLVPNELIIKCMTDHLKEVQNKSFLLDGFPRNVTQAKRLSTIQQINAVINLNVPHEVIIERIEGRWIHLKSGRVYNTGFNKPKVPGKDDITGDDLVKREDDKVDIVAERLKIYDAMIKPVLEYYQQSPGLIATFKGSTTNEIWPKVEKFIVDLQKSLNKLMFNCEYPFV